MKSSTYLIDKSNEKKKRFKTRKPHSINTMLHERYVLFDIVVTIVATRKKTRTKLLNRMLKIRIHQVVA